MAIKVKQEIKGTGPDQLKKVFDQIKLLDPQQNYRVYVLDHKRLSSSKQMRYLWGIVYKTISDHTGISVNEVHALMSHKFLLRTTYINGHVYEYIVSTKDVDTGRMTEYINEILVWALTELDCRIPKPNEMDDDTILEVINRGI